MKLINKFKNKLNMKGLLLYEKKSHQKKLYSQPG